MTDIAFGDLSGQRLGRGSFIVQQTGENIGLFMDFLIEIGFAQHFIHLLDQHRCPVLSHR